jgi:hypothetical protein
MLLSYYACAPQINVLSERPKSTIKNRCPNNSRSGNRCFLYAVILLAIVGSPFVVQISQNQSFRWQRSRIQVLFDEMKAAATPADCQPKDCYYEQGIITILGIFNTKTQWPYESLFGPRHAQYSVPAAKLADFEKQLREIIKTDPPSRALLWKVMELTEGLSPATLFTTGERISLEECIGPKPDE